MGKSNVVRIPDAYAKEMRSQIRVDRAREHNKQVALDLVAAGIPVFLANPENKASLVKAFNRLDKDIPVEEGEALRREFYDKHKFNPLHIGATTDRATVRRMFREKPDALPAISCGPAGLLVVDNDVKDRNGVSRNGVELFDSFCEQRGGLPEGVIAVESQGKDRHLYFANEGGHGCSAGRLKANCETDVKAIGGFVIAPSAIRIHDGRRYGERASLDALIAAYKGGRLVPVPSFVVQAIGDKSTANSSLSERDVQTIADDLRQTELPDGATLLDPILDGVDWDKLVSRYDGLRKAIEHGDRSDTRYHLARALKRERPEATPAEFAAIVLERPDECGAFVEDDKPSQGEFNWRNLARDFSRAEAVPGSDGSAFDAVDGDEDEPGIDTGKERSDVASFAFELEHDVAAKAKPPVWLVHEILEERTLSVLYGQPNSGKSLVLLDMLFHIAAGKPWRERDVKRGCVLYLAVEGPNGTARRSKAWRVHHAIADDVRLPLAFIRVGVNLYANERDAKKIVAAVSQLEKVTGLPCVAVAIDTLSAVTPGMDQNNEMGTFVKHCRKVLEGTKAAVIVVHHDGKDQSRGMRGGSELLGAVDSTMLVKDRVAKTMKMRDGISDQKFPFEIRVLNLWMDKKGRPVGAPVAVEPERGAALGTVDDDDDDAPMLKMADRREDRIAAILDVFEKEAKRQKADDENVLAVRRQLELQSGEIVEAVNARRKSDGLEMLSRSTVRDHVMAAVEAGSLEACGTKGKPLYRLA